MRNGEYISGCVLNNYPLEFENEDNSDNRFTIERILALILNDNILDKHFNNGLLEIEHYDEDGNLIESDNVYKIQNIQRIEEE